MHSYRETVDKLVLFHQIKDYMQEVEQWHVTSFAGKEGRKMENNIIVSENRNLHNVVNGIQHKKIVIHVKSFIDIAYYICL